MVTKQKRIGIIITVFSVIAVLAAGGAVTTIVLVTKAHHKHDIQEADKVAEKFEDKAVTWREDTIEDLHDELEGSYDDFDGVSDVVDEKVEDAPSPGKAPSYGKEHSSSYKSAKKHADSLTDGLEDIKSAVEDANEKFEWEEDANDIVTDAIDITLPSAASDAKKLRKNVLSKYKKNFKKFKKLDEPDDADDAVKAIKKGFEHAKKKVSSMADAIEDREPHKTVYPDKKLMTSRSELSKYKDSIGSGIEDAIDEFDDSTSTSDA